MHAFASDGNTIFILDAFGLSRVALDKRAVKTNVDLWGGALVCAGARLTLAPISIGPATIVDTKTLARAKGARELYGDVVAHPDGKRVLSVEGARLEIGAARTSLKPKRLGACAVGRPLPLPVSPMSRGLVATDHEGVVAHYDLERGLLTRFCLSGARPTDVVAIDVPPPIGELSLSVARGCVLFSSREPSTRRAHALILDERAKIRLTSLESVSPLAFDGRSIAFQPDEQSVVVQASDGAKERFPLPSKARGVGEPIVREERVLFVPPSRESLVDLRTLETIDRKLAPSERAARRKLIAFSDHATTIGRPFDVVFAIGRKSYPGVKKRDTVLSGSLGDQSLFAALAIGAVTRAFVDRFRPPSTTSALAVTSTSEAAVRKGLDTLKHLGVSLVDALPGCCSAFGSAIGRVSVRRPAARASVRRRIFQGKAGTRFIEAVIGGPLTASRLQAFDAGAPMRFPGNAREALAWALVEVMGPAAGPILFAWIVSHPDRYSAANVGNASEALQRLCELHPKARPPLIEACERAKSVDVGQRRRAKELLIALERPRR